MKRSFFLLSFFITAGTAYCQNVINGYVTELNSGKKNIPGVQVSFIGANPATSDNLGKFTLVFPEKEYGTSIFFKTIYKKGFEIVNTTELRPASLVSDRDIKIILCEEGLLDKMKAAYYNISVESIINAHKKNMNELEQALANAKDNELALIQKMELLDRQKADAISQANDLAEKFARTNFDDVSGLYVEAFEQFKGGNIDSALHILNKKDLVAEARKIISEDRDIEQRQRENEARKDTLMKNIGLKAELHSLKYEFEKADSLYYILCQLDTSNYRNLRDYSIVLERQNKLKDALEWYTRAHRHAHSYHEQLQALLNLSKISSITENYDNNRKYTLLALDFVETQKNEQIAIEPYMILAVKYRYAELLQKEEKYPEAFNYLEEVLRELPASTESMSVEMLTEYGNALNKLGIIKFRTKEYDDASVYFLKSLHTFSTLDSIYPGKHTNTYVQIYNNLGLSEQYTGNMEMAEEYLQNALSKNKELVEVSRYSYLPDLAANYGHLGILYRAKKNYPAAKEMFRLSTGYFSELARFQPEPFHVSAAKSYVNTGIICLDLDEADSLEIYMKMAEREYNNMTAANGRSYRQYIAKNKLTVGFYYQKKNEYTRAYQYITAALDDEMAFAQQFPGFIPAVLAFDLNYIGELNKQFQSYDSTVLYFERIIPDLNALVQETGHEDYLSTVYGSLSSWYFYAGQFDKAIESAIKGLALDPSNEWITINLSASYLYQGKYKEARAAIEEVIEHPYTFDGSKTLGDVYLLSLDEFEKNGFSHPDAVKIRKYLSED